MKAMVLAAGLGERMRPLTEHIPKPLLEIHGKPLLQYHIEALASAGIRELVINHGRLGHMIEQRFGDGAGLAVEIVYSPEGETPLETGGGIQRALTLLGCNPFIVVNADVWTDYDFAKLPREPKGLAHLVLVNNPPHHKKGDFFLHGDKVLESGNNRLTYAGIGVYSPHLFKDRKDVSFPLASLLRTAISEGNVNGEYFSGAWLDVGTPERIAELNKGHK